MVTPGRTMNVFLKYLILPSLIIGLTPAAFADTVIYNSIPSPLPPNIPSLGYEATSASEFGGLIQFAGGNPFYSLTTATVAMSDWALATSYTPNGTTITATGFYVPLTLSLYNVGAGNTVGSLIGMDLINAFIPWRPAPSGSCGTGYLGGDGLCYNGSMSTATFNLSGITVPNQVIYGLSFNTTDYGANPTGVPGPYDSLNFGAPSSGPSVGSDPLPGTAYWNTTYAGFYADNGAGGVGTFRQDTTWDNIGAIQFSAASPTPEPSSLMLLGTGLVGLAGFARRKISRA
jgi:hypothetical protein